MRSGCGTCRRWAPHWGTWRAGPRTGSRTFSDTFACSPANSTLSQIPDCGVRRKITRLVRKLFWFPPSPSYWKGTQAPPSKKYRSNWPPPKPVDSASVHGSFTPPTARLIPKCQWDKDAALTARAAERGLLDSARVAPVVAGAAGGAVASARGAPHRPPLRPHQRQTRRARVHAARHLACLLAKSRPTASLPSDRVE